MQTGRHTGKTDERERERGQIHYFEQREAKVRAKGTRGQNWYSDKRVAFLRSKAKPQSSWLLHLAGDHHQNFENKPLLHAQHMMRCMLTSNVAVDQRFANGTQDDIVSV